MKQRSIFNTGLVVVFLFLGALQQTVIGQSFEGIIDLVITNEQIQEETKIEWHKKGNNHRLNIQSTTPGFTYTYVVLLKSGSGVMEMLTDVEGTKNVYTIPLEKIKVTDLPLPGAKQTISKEENTVSGFNCRLMDVNSNVGNVKYWLTDDVEIPLNEFPSFLRTANYFKYLEVQQIKGVPVKIVSTDENYKPHFTQTITSITKEKINDSIFSIPSGYEPK